MNTEDIKNLFKTAGWTEYPRSADSGEGVVAFYESPALDSSYKCECNDRPPAVHAEIQDFTFPRLPKPFQSVTFTVRGEFGGQWCSLGVYGISFDEVEEFLPRVEAIGLKLWEAYCEAVS